MIGSIVFAIILVSWFVWTAKRLQKNVWILAAVGLLIFIGVSGLFSLKDIQKGIGFWLYWDLGIRDQLSVLLIYSGISICTILIVSLAFQYSMARITAEQVIDKSWPLPSIGWKLVPFPYFVFVIGIIISGLLGIIISRTGGPGVDENLVIAGIELYNEGPIITVIALYSGLVGVFLRRPIIALLPGALFAELIFTVLFFATGDFGPGGFFAMPIVGALAAFACASVSYLIEGYIKYMKWHAYVQHCPSPP